ncbi:hypothetical protein [Mailhella sp.]|uniref:hypothetical protein n=1 Tax=Mailhella sp. TaxID=1981029 RepID=UPI004064C88D
MKYELVKGYECLGADSTIAEEVRTAFLVLPRGVLLSIMPGLALILILTVSLFVPLPLSAAERLTESFRPSVDGVPLTLALGGRLLDLDVWAVQALRWDDNIYQSAEFRTEDLIRTTGAGFKLAGEERGLWKIRFDGQLEYHSFTDHPCHNGAEGYLRSQVSAQLSPALGLRLAAEAERQYDTMRHEQSISPVDRCSVSGDLVLRPSPYAGLEAGYRCSVQRHDISRMGRQDYDEHTLTLRPYHELSPYTTLYALASLSQNLPCTDWTGRSLASSLSLGLQWACRDAARVSAELGLMHMSFEDGGQTAQPDSGVTRPVLRLSAELALDHAWTAGLELSSRPTVGAVSSNAVRSRWIDRILCTAFLGYAPGEGRFMARLSPFFRRGEPSCDAGWREYGFTLGLSWGLAAWCRASVGWRCFVIDYSDQRPYGRNQITVGLGAAF